ncbi:MAG: class I SAM-dependent RNA methyltransferase [Betaproteobacteria bacterium]|nr:class I SAM-dependent RNA methyltransferase [Betaproteobacteria bacterium]
MNQLQLFLPCAAGVEELLAEECLLITDQQPGTLKTTRGGVLVQASWRDVMLLNLHSRLAQRVLVQLSNVEYRSDQDIYENASEVAWEIWFTPKQSFKIEITAQHSPVKSLNYSALLVKDAICDRFRHKSGVRPNVETRWPDARVYVHLSATHQTLYMDTSGEALFKRGWRTDKGDAPLKETLAAAMIAASGWDGETPLYDPCCGSGTIAIEAAQIACNIAPGGQRQFGFEKLLPYQSHVWSAIKSEAKAAESKAVVPIFGSDVAHRMVDFAMRNAERAGVGDVVQLRGGDALQRLPPCDKPGILLLNPPYGERIEAAGFAGTASGARTRRGGRESAWLDPTADPVQQNDSAGDAASMDSFFRQLSTHWKTHYMGWTAWVLTPDLKLPGRMRFKESRRVPMWNGPIECRMFRFEISAMPDKNAKLPEV